nr:DUF6153 family protein [Streptomyces polyasparticus]
MTTDRAPRSRPAGRLLVLLVMAVLTGVLGMHALPPGGAPAPHAKPMAHAAAMGQTSVGEHAPAGAHETAQCAHSGHGSDHLEHADGTCAATGIGSPYVPPALSAAPVNPPAVVRAEAPEPGVVRDRAPPDLSEMQLLRI